MKREKNCCKPCTWYFQLPENSEQQNRCQGMQKDIHQMVGQRRRTPKLVLRPEGRGHDGIVLPDGAGYSPDSNQPVHGKQFRPDQVLVIIPDMLSVPDRPVRQQRNRDEEKGEEPVALPQRKTGSCRCSWSVRHVDWQFRRNGFGSFL